MSGGPVLSAVARRRAKTEASAATSPELPQQANTSAPVDVTLTTSITPSLPLKRKTSAQNLKPNGHSATQTLEPRSRKRLKAPQSSRVIPATEVPVSLNHPRERPYSPSQPLGVSSDEEDDTLPSVSTTSGFGDTTPQVVEVDSSLRIAKNIPSLIEMENYFTLTPDEAHSITGRRTTTRVVLLNQGESLLFVGTIELTLLQGSIRLLGTTLSPSRTSHRIFAPRSHPIPVLDVVGESTGSSWQQPNQQIHRLVSELPERITKFISSSHAVLVFQELVTGIEGLGRVIPTFAGIFEPDNRDRGITERILGSAHIYRSESQTDTTFHFPDDWQQAISNILSDTSSAELNDVGNYSSDAPVILVRGAKNSGKSTFCRSLANNLTTRYHRVSFIECDIGQSEFTPGGMVSLNILRTPIFGPPFTHPGRPRCAHFVGSTSPKTSPSYYLAALSDLAQRYQLEIKYSGSLDDDTTSDEDNVKNSDSVPLVINTQGWVKGMGADLLRSIEESFAPTHVVEFQSPHIPTSLETFRGRPVVFSEQSSQNMHRSRSRLIKLLPTVSSSNSPRFSGADLRSLALASYFYGRSDQKNNDINSDSWITRWDTSLSLRSIAPITIDIHSSLEGIIIVAPAGDDVVPADLSRAVVCGVVGLVAPDSLSTLPGTPYTQGALPPSPQNSRCVGLGFVRGASATHLHLLTPVPAGQLKLCRMLVLGEIMMPVWAFLETEGDSIEENGLPFLQWGRSIAEDAGGERRRIRRNIMRRGHL